MEYMDSPGSIDLFTRYMHGKIDELVRLGTYTGFQSLFRSREQFSLEAEVLDVHIRRGYRRIAMMAPRGIEGTSIGDIKRNITLNKWTEVSRMFPLIEAEASITTNDINKRMFGEIPYSGMTKEARMRKLAVELADEMTREICRTNELLAAQAFILATMVAKIKTTDVSLIYDFKRLATHQTTTTGWGTATDLDFLADLDTGCDLIIRDGHLKPDLLFLGSDALVGMQNQASFESIANLRRVAMIESEMENKTISKLQFLVDNGFDYQGKIKTHKGRVLSIFTYEECYDDPDTGTSTPYLDPDYALIASSEAVFEKLYGPKDYLESTVEDRSMMQTYFGFNTTANTSANVIKGRAFNNSSVFWDCRRGQDKKTISLRAQQAPLFIPVDVDATYLLTNAGSSS